MSSETLLDVQDVSKKYSKNVALSLKYGFRDAIKKALGIRQESVLLRSGEFWALRNVCFQLRRGDRIGLLGRNGAGKSTLLKVISGLSQPDGGTVTLNGSMDQIIELTAGFHEHLTGRENARIRTQLLGYSKGHQEFELSRILEFTELGEFFDMPIKFYSSGMKARLGFAVSTISKPDVLLIDEALAVGDLSFRLKCYEYLGDYLANSAVVLVSHSVPVIKKYCNYAAVMEKGAIKFAGDVDRAIELYQDTASFANWKSSEFNSQKVDFILSSGGRVLSEEDTVSPSDMVELELSLSDVPEGARLSVSLCDGVQRHVAEWHSVRDEVFYTQGKKYVCNLGKMSLNPGYYGVNVSITGPDGFSLIAYTPWKRIRVVGEMMGLAPLQQIGGWKEIGQ